MIIPFKRTTPSYDPDEIYASDDVVGSINGNTGGEGADVGVSLYVAMNSDGDTVIYLIGTSDDELTVGANVVLSPEQARAMGRALIGKFDD